MGKHIVKFYSLGNADTSLISLSNGKYLLWDYANVKTEDADDKRIDLPSELSKEVKEDFDFVCFTHADTDHIKGFSDYFYLEHAKKYQDENRKHINELWVPASVLMDTHAEDEAKILKAEARHRLKSKDKIKVFSRPDKMKAWCDDQDDISYDEVKHLFVDAGKLVPGLTKDTDGIEIFVHSPFASDSKEIDRNGECIVVQAEFNDNCTTKLILGADTPHEVWIDIVNITKHYKHESRLEWDVFHISHHSSYLSLSDEKGKDKTNPKEEIKWLFETQGNSRGRMISSSKPIPAKNSDADGNQPPHRQAAAYYEDVANGISGEYLVTMEYPTESSPEPIVLEIDEHNCTKLLKKVVTSATYIASKNPPRAGKW